MGVPDWVGLKTRNGLEITSVNMWPGPDRSRYPYLVCLSNGGTALLTSYGRFWSSALTDRLPEHSLDIILDPEPAHPLAGCDYPQACLEDSGRPAGAYDHGIPGFGVE